MLSAVNKWVYGPTPEERVRKWRQTLRKEGRQLEREVRQLDQATSKTRTSLKQVAKRGDQKSARILAKEIVRSNKQRDRLLKSRATLNSIDMQLQHQLATLKVTGSLQKSSDIMKLSNRLINLPQISATMREMSMEMTKAGIMDEMLQDVMEDVEEDDVDAEADEEVDKVLLELTDGKLSAAAPAGGEALPELEAPTAEREEEDAADLERMQKQLDGLLRG